MHYHNALSNYCTQEKITLLPTALQIVKKLRQLTANGKGAGVRKQLAMLFTKKVPQFRVLMVTLLIKLTAIKK